MATEVALAAEENGKIVSAVYPKSYLPSHGVCYETSNCILCIFADAIRTGYAEAKKDRPVLFAPSPEMQSAQDTPRQSRRRTSWGSRYRDAIRTGYAEAKQGASGICARQVGCHPHRIRRGKDQKRYSIRRDSWMQSAQDTPRQRAIWTGWTRPSRDAIRTGYAEAKCMSRPIKPTMPRCNPHRICRGKGTGKFAAWARRKDAIRTGYAEAKTSPKPSVASGLDAIRTGYAEEKFFSAMPT